MNFHFGGPRHGSPRQRQQQQHQFDFEHPCWPQARTYISRSLGEFPYLRSYVERRGKVLEGIIPRVPLPSCLSFPPPRTRIVVSGGRRKDCGQLDPSLRAIQVPAAKRLLGGYSLVNQHEFFRVVLRLVERECVYIYEVISPVEKRSPSAEKGGIFSYRVA